MGEKKQNALKTEIFFGLKVSKVALIFHEDSLPECDFVITEYNMCFYNCYKPMNSGAHDRETELPFTMVA